MDMFEKWNSNVDLNGLQKDIKDAQENKREYEEIPHGEYEVKVAKMELKSSKKGDPMVSIWFTILEGKFKKSKLFLNQVVTVIDVMSDFCEVTNGNNHQTIYFKNLRKVVN